jgi:hypothetical protein
MPERKNYKKPKEEQLQSDFMKDEPCREGTKLNSPNKNNLKRVTINEAVFIFEWYDKDTERFYNVAFSEHGDLAGGYSYPKGEDDHGIFQEECAEVGWENGVLMFIKSLIENEKEKRKEFFGLPLNVFEAKD